MSMTDDQLHQVRLYGRLLTGEETELQLAQYARQQYLKAKVRPRLAAAIGDTGDNLTDAVRALVLGDAIHLGIVTDPAVIAAYTGYIQAMLEGYGGPEAIVAVLSKNMAGLGNYLVGGYYQAKMQIWACDNVDAVNRVDLPGEPEIERS